MADLPTTLHDKLMDIQQSLKVPKEQNNEFGNFKYRKLEDIEDKIKPLLKKHGLALIFSDEMVGVGDRVYVKATVRLTDGLDTIEAYAYAREATTPKAKMDDAQLTGSCSSYARKYAAAGLFLIDNEKDADDLVGDKDLNRPTTAQKQEIIGLSAILKISPTADDREAYAEYLLEAIGVPSVENQEQARQLIKRMELDVDGSVGKPLPQFKPRTQRDPIEAEDNSSFGQNTEFFDESR